MVSYTAGLLTVLFYSLVKGLRESRGGRGDAPAARDAGIPVSGREEPVGLAESRLFVL